MNGMESAPSQQRTPIEGEAPTAKNPKRSGNKTDNKNIFLGAPNRNVPLVGNMTYAEAMCFFPCSVLYNADLLLRGINNLELAKPDLKPGIQLQTLLAKMANYFREPVRPEDPFNNNTICNGIQNTMKAHGFVGWTGKKHAEQKLVPQGWATDVISVDGFNTEFDYIPDRATSRGGHSEILFRLLPERCRAWPEDHDAVDITRMIHWATYKEPQINYMYPRDYAKLLRRVGGPKPVTPENLDWAVFERWSGVEARVSRPEPAGKKMAAIQEQDPLTGRGPPSQHAEAEGRNQSLCSCHGLVNPETSYAARIYFDAAHANDPTPPSYNQYGRLRNPELYGFTNDGLSGYSGQEANFGAAQQPSFASFMPQQQNQSQPPTGIFDSSPFDHNHGNGMFPNTALNSQPSQNQYQPPCEHIDDSMVDPNLPDYQSHHFGQTSQVSQLQQPLQAPKQRPHPAIYDPPSNRVSFLPLRNMTNDDPENFNDFSESARWAKEQLVYGGSDKWDYDDMDMIHDIRRREGWVSEQLASQPREYWDQRGITVPD